MPTKTKSKTPLRDELQALYDLRAEWQAKRKQASADLRQLRDKITDLADTRLSLINRDRTLVDHDLMPVSPTNPVAEVDEQLAELPDLGEAERIYDHARALEEQYDREARHFAEHHYRELVAELEPEAIAAAEHLADSRAEFLAALARYKDVRDLSFEWARLIQGLDEYRVVPGGFLIDALNQIREWQIPAPVDPLENAEAHVIHDPTDPDLDHRE